MASKHLHPYQPLDEVRRVVDRFHLPGTAIVHPQRIMEGMRAERSAFSRFNGVLADHIVGLAGTMLFFYFLCLLLGGWTLWQSGIEHNDGFDPFPFAFLIPFVYFYNLVDAYRSASLINLKAAGGAVLS